MMDSVKKIKRHVATASMALAFTLIGSVNSFASVDFDPITWDSGLEGWDARNDATLLDTTVANLNNPGSGGAGGSGGYLNLPFSTTSATDFLRSNAMLMDFVALGGAENFTSGANNVNSLTFQFTGYPLATQSVYLESSYNGETTKWLSSQFSTSSAGTWEAQSIGFTEDWSWTAIGSTSVSFANALTEVTKIGVDVSHSSATPATFDFKLDDWQFSHDVLAVPEPGTIMMSLTALLGMLGICRRQIRDGLASLKGSA